MNRLTTRHAAKKTQLRYPCRVCSQECSYEEESIQCDGCQCWLHQHCIRMTLTQYVEYSHKPSLQFFCLRCACDSDGHYNFRASLERIACLALDVSRMRDQAETENRLLALYGITLPPLSAPYARDVVVDRPSVSLLQHHSQWLLKQYVPAAVGADGNCLFRAVLLALYGHDGLYDHLRLLTTTEVLLQPSLYDSTSAEYYAPYTADDRLMLYTYDNFVKETVKDGAYSDMLTVLALSSVCIRLKCTGRRGCASFGTIVEPGKAHMEKKHSTYQGS